MIPAHIVLLDELPLTPSGKVDQRRLSRLDLAPDLQSVFVAPRTTEECALARIWSDVLSVERVGIHDNFFELGGDSILVIQVIARAAQMGLELSPKQFFQYPTVAKLAAVAGTTRVVRAEQGPVTGPMPLTPIQRWFFEQPLTNANHWNQSVLLEAQEPLQPDLLKRCVAQLLEHHDALRHRFSVAEDGWRQTALALDDEIPFIYVDLPQVESDERESAMRQQIAQAQASLDISHGPLLRVVYFDFGEAMSGRLLMVIHHLTVDGVSWRILLEDLQTVYQQLLAGERPQLPPKTSSFQEWSRRLNEYAQQALADRELFYWMSKPRGRLAQLPVDFPGGRNDEASIETIGCMLTSEETQALQTHVAAAYGAHVEDALLAAFVRIITQATDSEAVRVDMEGHGREEIIPDVDLSRTVGWFTTLYPLTLSWRQPEDLGKNLAEVKEQLAQVPHGGIGYGLLRYLRQDSDLTRLAGPQAEISFNYLGRFGQPSQGAMGLKLSDESVGLERDPASPRSHLLDVSARIIAGQLRIEWAYSANLHRRATVQAWVDEYVLGLRKLIAHCQSVESGQYTPSDFEDVDLGQEDIDALLAELNEASHAD